MSRWRCVVKGSPSEQGVGGAGNRAAGIPVVVCRPPRRSRPVNDNHMPLKQRVRRVVGILLTLGAAAGLMWSMTF
jgi:hypothetical protein